MLLYGFLFFILLTVLFFSLYLKERQAHVTNKKATRNYQHSLEEQLNQAKEEKTGFLKDKIDLEKRLTEQQTLNHTLQQQIEDQLEKQQHIIEENRLQFENISNKLLDKNASKFTEQNRANLNQLLKPFQEKIKDFEKKVEDTYQQEARERFSLQNELRQTLKLNQVLSEQADNLTKALKSDNKTQGDWGEFVLEKVLESAGLQEGLHYKKQVTFSSEEGKKLRPDIVLFLPEKKHIIIDSKVSLTAFERYYNANNKTEQQQALKDHLRSVKQHIEELSQKKYERFVDRTPDFVLLFIPLEPAYNLALINKKSLYETAFRKRVILVSVSSLMATLRIIESIWRLEKQNKNAGEIIEEGNKLYDKLVGFVTDMQELGRKLTGAEKSYDQAMKKLSDGRGNLLRRADKMKSLGLNPSKQLPNRPDD